MCVYHKTLHLEREISLYDPFDPVFGKYNKKDDNQDDSLLHTWRQTRDLISYLEYCQQMTSHLDRRARDQARKITGDALE